MTEGKIALLISCSSLAISGVALGWNIYRDVVVKPKLKVSIKDVAVLHPSFNNEKRVVVSVVNHGPGKSQANGLLLREKSLWKRILRKGKAAFLIHDYEDPLSGKLPKDLEVGEKIDLTFRYGNDIFILDDNLNQIGVSDPFGKTHWCKSKEYSKAKASYLKNTANQSQVDNG